MQVILTHEQADFDALAALLGASLLQENAVAVLPRKMNRNARAFLNLYGADLPFVEPRDLPAAPIEAVTLVDTQSMITLKGASTKTQVQVIDHHQLRPDLPEDWQVNIERTGATTTLFVEGIQENNLHLPVTYATLLLLGIYEDTGSLTYSSTTARDIRAAAFLVEQGASLRTAVKFLNPPLSAEQRRVYERLLASAEWLHIQEQNVVVACADAQDMHEEISSVAHKIRDLLDPDALFLLVTTSEGVRLVARSTTERIDVGGVAAHFGGGGHERAAAALIRVEEHSKDGGEAERKLNEVHQELARILPQKIHPAITIGQIMSRRPRLLSPTTTAEEAGQLMQRYGYEGYPVVSEGKVIGLLTRRAVDRALAHKLNLPAASLMDAGEITVHPEQALEHLQRVMTGSGWGQVPVVDPGSGDVIGIVTRTDLLKTLGNEAQIPTRQNLTHRLEGALPTARLQLLKLVAEQAAEQRAALYIVGGFVRDLLLERPSQDFDVVVEGDAIALARRMAAEFGGQVTSHARFGTAKWEVSAIKPELAARLGEKTALDPADLPDSLDLITARTEFYERPTALPTVERSSIKLDLHRRDFTINTLALRLDGRHYGELHDYWGGLDDLKQSQVRVLHSLSFIDDPTRILRAVRFEQRFGFQIEYRTLQLMSEARELLKQVSGDRIRHELNLILAEERSEAILNRLEELRLLEAIHTDLPSRIPGDWKSLPPPEWGIPHRLGGVPIQRILAYTLWFSGLTVEQARSIGSRIKLSRGMQEIVQAAVQLAGELPGLTQLPPSQVTARLDGLPLPALYAIYQLVDLEDQKALLYQYATRWRKVMPSANGDTLRQSGLDPGPQYRDILETLRAAWLDGQIHTTEQEQAMFDALLKRALASQSTD